jgi:transcriptional activator
MDRGRCWVDAWSVDRLLSRAAALVERGTPAGDAGLERIAAAVVRLYRGAFLRGEDVPPICAAYRERLRAKALRFVEARARQLRSSGRDVDARALERWASERAPPDRRRAG